MKFTDSVIALSVLAPHFKVLAQRKTSAFPGTAVSWGKDRIDLFGVSLDYGGQIWHKAYDGAKNGWKTEHLNISAYSSSPPVAISRGKDRLDVFSASAGLAYQTWDGKKWLPQLPEGSDEEDPAFISEDGTGAPSVTSWDSNRVDVIVRTYDGLYGRKYFDGSTWQPKGQDLEDLGKDGFGGQTFEADPASVSWGKDSLDVFGILDNGTLVHKFWNGQAWKPSATGWQSWGDGFYPYSTPTVISRADKTLEIFALKSLSRTALANVWYTKWDSSKKLAWDNLGGYIPLDTKGRIAGPAVTYWDGRIDLFSSFVAGPYVQGFHKWNEDGNWKPANQTEDGESYADWDDHNITASATTSLTSVSSGKNNINLFFLDGDQAVQWQQWDGKDWSPKDGGSTKVESKYLSSSRALRANGGATGQLDALRRVSSGRARSHNVRPLVAEAKQEKLGL